MFVEDRIISMSGTKFAGNAATMGTQHLAAFIGLAVKVATIYMNVSTVI